MFYAIRMITIPWPPPPWFLHRSYTQTPKQMQIQIRMHMHMHAGAKAIAAGRRHSMVLKEDGTVWVTGYNREGQFGDGTISNANSLKPGPCGTMV